MTLTTSHTRAVKPDLVLDRPAKPEDSTERTRPSAAIVKGTPIETITTLEKLLEATFIDEGDKVEDGHYLVDVGVVRAEITQTDDNVRLHCVTKRPDHPVIFGIDFSVEENGDLKLWRGFANHRNPELDTQVVNNPYMLEFALSKVYEEVRLNKDPKWWLDTLQAYDESAGTSYTQAHIDKFHGGVDPRADAEQPQFVS